MPRKKKVPETTGAAIWDPPLAQNQNEPTASGGVLERSPGKLDLSTVTLIQIATRPEDFEAARVAQAQCLELANFGAVVFMDSEVAPHVTDYESYNRFVVRELAQHFETPHCLLIQSDGFILRPEAWDPAFLNFDYVGAPWGDGVVGNGGLSLRSKRFCEVTAALSEEAEAAIAPDGVLYAPEDQTLCRDWKPRLDEAGLTFADPETASRFSWELHDNWPIYKGSFGFHGQHTLERLTALKAQGKLGEFAEIPIPPNKWNS